MFSLNFYILPRTDFKNFIKNTFRVLLRCLEYIGEIIDHMLIFPYGRMLLISQNIPLFIFLKLSQFTFKYLIPLFVDFICIDIFNIKNFFLLIEL